METESEKKKYKHKSHFCIFCKIEVKRIHEHFVRKHAEEERIKQILRTEKKEQRFWLWKRLAQEGDNYFNNLSDLNLGKRKIVKQPSTEIQDRRYYTCQKCYSRILNINRIQHKKSCEKILTKNILNGEEISENDIYFGISEKIINKIRVSPHLSNFIKHLTEIKDSKSSVRTVMSDIIDLEENMKKLTKSKKSNLSKLLCVTQVDNFISSVKNLCGCSQTNNEVVFSKNNMDNEVLNISKFSAIFEAESGKKIVKQALTDIKKRKLKKQSRLPKLTHVNFLTEKLKEETPHLMDRLKAEKTPTCWRMLAENTLLRLTIFNRRRGGAVEKMKVKDFISTEVRSKVSTEEAIFDLNEEDREFLDNVKVVEILHKCNNLIPIIINKELQEAMDLLLQHRDQAGIVQDNEYFFAASKGSLNPIRGVKIMEKYRQYLPENVRHLFTATNLRKHGATTTQLLDLSLQDKEEWAHHLGHSVEVHDKYYRNKELVNGLLKTGRILTALDEGTIKYFKGKKISDIPLKGSTTPGQTPKTQTDSLTDYDSAESFVQNIGDSSKRKEGTICKVKKVLEFDSESDLEASEDGFIEGYSCGETQKNKSRNFQGFATSTPNESIKRAAIEYQPLLYSENKNKP